MLPITLPQLYSTLPKFLTVTTCHCRSHMMAQPGETPLLRGLGQLNDDVWEQTLLPKLVADGSAPSVALTCSTLRQLCQRSRPQLNMAALASTNPATVKRWMQGLPERFPACMFITIEVCEENCITIPTILGALARMPQLSALAVSVALGQQPLAAAMAISSISSRLPQLRYLGVYSTDSLVSAQQVWDSLGTATQLTALNIQFASGVRTGCTVHNLLPLGSLTGLQQLIIGERWGRQQQEGGGSFAFLGALTALTFLDIAIPSTTGLSSISSCTALQTLRLRAPSVLSSRDVARLTTRDWEAVGQLTRLLELRVSVQQQPSSLREQQPFYAAVGKLTRLRTVTAGMWTAAALPVLAGLPRLRCVGGMWTSFGDAGGAVCEHVTCLEHAAREVPFGAFPNLEIVIPVGRIHAAAWQSMAACCPKLRQFCSVLYPVQDGAAPEFQAWHSFEGGVPEAERMSAVRSLSQLTALTKLSFHAAHPLEVAVLAAAVPGVRELHVGVLRRMGCALLAPLAKLALLSSLSLHLLDTDPDQRLEAQLLLLALCHVPKVLVTGSARCVAVFNEAVQEARRLRLLLPADLQVVAR